MVIAQTYAQFNHDSIQREICKKLKCTATDMIRSVHNYIDMNDFIIRKGAIRAYEGELCVIPFNMRDGLLICKGKGNDSWNNSAPHGAGRVLARGKAKNTLSLEEFEEKMKGIYSTSVVKETLDESPMAYKDSEIIEILIDPTVEIVDRIKPILNIKSID
jgi:RNA-splicing ligase RtcB